MLQDQFTLNQNSFIMSKEKIIYKHTEDAHHNDNSPSEIIPILIKNFNHKTISLHANELPNSNIIFFKVYNNDKVISTGKLIHVKSN